MPELRFGVFVPQGWKMELSSIADPADKWAKAVEIATMAEELGYDSLWVFDHFHNVPRPAHETMFECWTTLAAISQRTSRIKLGQMVGCARRTGSRRCSPRSPRTSTSCPGGGSSRAPPPPRGRAVRPQAAADPEAAGAHRRRR
jgi:hypothetical protein